MGHPPDSPGRFTRIMEHMGISRNRGAHVEPQLGRGGLSLVNLEDTSPRARPAVPEPAVPEPAAQRHRSGGSPNQGRSRHGVNGPREAPSSPVDIPQRPRRRGSLDSPNFGRTTEEGEFRPGAPPRGPRDPRPPLDIPRRRRESSSHAAPPGPSRPDAVPPVPPIPNFNSPGNQPRVPRCFDLPGAVSGFSC